MIKRRVPIVSFLLSLVLTGLGHVYNGDPLKGVLFYLGMWVMWTVIRLAGPAYFFSGLIALTVAAHAYPLLVAVLAAWDASNKIDCKMKWYNRWYVYTGLFLIAHLGFDLQFRAVEYIFLVFFCALIISSRYDLYENPTCGTNREIFFRRFPMAGEGKDLQVSNVGFLPIISGYA